MLTRRLRQPDSASSAVRNLNDYEIMGRKLRVDFSNEQKSTDDDNQGSSSHNPHANGGNGVGGAPTPAPSSLPPLPAGKDLPPGVKCIDAISQTLNTLPPAQLLDILAQMKTLAAAEPHRATELLHQAPQLSAAVFQALLLMGLVSPESISSVLDQGVQQPPPAAAAFAPPPAAAGYPGATNTPPVGALPFGAPPPMAQAQGYGAPAVQPPAQPAAQDTEALMRAVMELSEAQINLLPENEKQQILAIRASFAGQRR